LSRLPTGTGVITADIDLEAQAESRDSFPALKNRRLGAANTTANPTANTTANTAADSAAVLT